MRIWFVTLFLLSVPAAAQVHSPESAEILRVDATWNELRLKADVKALNQILADDWLLTHSDGRVQTKVEYIGELASRSRTNQAITNEDVQLHLYPGVAVVTGKSVQSGEANGKPWHGEFRFTRVWTRLNGTWVMVASHSSRITPKE